MPPDGVPDRAGLLVAATLRNGVALVLDPPAAMPADADAAVAAVLVPIVDTADPFILLTRRATTLRHHPDQVSFPGGRIDRLDRDVAGAALREAVEEIALEPRLVRVAGALPPVLTGSGFTVLPVVGVVDAAATWRAAPAEVASVLTLRLATLLDPGAPTERAPVAGGRPGWVWPHPTEYIWGATANILKALAGRLRPP